jgi:hypothetical protein
MSALDQTGHRDIIASLCSGKMSLKGRAGVSFPRNRVQRRSNILVFAL